MPFKYIRGCIYVAINLSTVLRSRSLQGNNCIHPCMDHAWQTKYKNWLFMLLAMLNSANDHKLVYSFILFQSLWDIMCKHFSNSGWKLPILKYFQYAYRRNSMKSWQSPTGNSNWVKLCHYQQWWWQTKKLWKSRRNSWRSL